MRLNNIKQLEYLGKQPESFWLELLKEYLLAVSNFNNFSKSFTNVLLFFLAERCNSFSS